MNSATTPHKTRIQVYKIVVLGDGGVGKSGTDVSSACFWSWFLFHIITETFSAYVHVHINSIHCYINVLYHLPVAVIHIYGIPCRQ